MQSNRLKLSPQRRVPPMIDEMTTSMEVLNGRERFPPSVPPPLLSPSNSTAIALASTRRVLKCTFLPLLTIRVICDLTISIALCVQLRRGFVGTQRTQFRIYIFSSRSLNFTCIIVLRVDILSRLVRRVRFYYTKNSNDEFGVRIHNSIDKFHYFEFARTCDK